MSNNSDNGTEAEVKIEANIKEQAQEILDWELSLDSRDIRAHAWYHGNISRLCSEGLLKENGDFLVRDCSSSGRVGDYVLSCHWNGNSIHFLILKEIIQPETIYELIHYRFESESFDSVPGLILYHVGSGIPISVGSGAIIDKPKNRTVPLLQNLSQSYLDGRLNDYASLIKAEPVSSEKVSSLERVMKQKSLNLTPPIGLIEDLEFIPAHIEKLMIKRKKKENERKEEEEVAYKENDNEKNNHNNSISSNNNRTSGGKEKKDLNNKMGSNFDLNSFQSILLPATSFDNNDIKMNKDLFETISNRILEAGERNIAVHITEIDWKVLSSGIFEEEKEKDEGIGEDDSENAKDKKGSEEDDDEEDEKVLKHGVYQLLFQNSQHRWNNIIERSLSFSYFVVSTILLNDKPEEMINKWISIAVELKTSIGNFFSFCSIMRGLLMPQITRTDGKINWMKLRADFTSTTLAFETTLRSAYQGYVRGKETYPPNGSIPELLLPALILEDSIELLPLSCINSEDDELQFYADHLNSIRSLGSWAEIQKRNFDRSVNESGFELDLVLLDIFKTELQLICLWGRDYSKNTLKERCESMNQAF